MWWGKFGTNMEMWRRGGRQGEGIPGRTTLTKIQARTCLWSLQIRITSPTKEVLYTDINTTSQDVQWDTLTRQGTSKSPLPIL